tara:strand:- start:52 stop:465 length:414 start_codon:yes stop_codon:yes gene_type:complete
MNRKEIMTRTINPQGVLTFNLDGSLIGIKADPGFNFNRTVVCYVDPDEYEFTNGIPDSERGLKIKLKRSHPHLFAYPRANWSPEKILTVAAVDKPVHLIVDYDSSKFFLHYTNREVSPELKSRFDQIKSELEGHLGW